MDDVLSLCRAWFSATPAIRTDLERRIIKMINPPSQDECLVAFQVGQYGVFARFAHGLVIEFNIKKKDKREIEIRLTRLWKDYGRIKRYPKHSPALLDDVLAEIKSLYVEIDDIERISGRM